ncbi:uncharacterized protein MONOS_2771 [Monocercomonoides exilis]|uniref:uncharacterized protein n=1 Tax=Monocercomonoides exilis TaxID=2049356 RepID=UPI00355AC272|nr:hypothetical protein MONOS_2771 [Monocercomonoides exilis]|eukprot:MONOS_2771.1-p1 / transcript=MONOS_2771.1 / gene=MONOS_2771 / organism=Monocercomonoides_exilis_PA203 / gene_product=unspecified product / transcript_product=unspecified product / location=Mono_scaffold00059:74136-76946(-) / protein_length=787 / sequence_SO=supercontig / SO=protein_coding / is_pseudo=false
MWGCRLERKMRPEQGCIEIDLTGDSPVPEESGLDSVGGETEVGTHKERGVSGMVVELREDGSDAPREEEKEKETKDEGPGSTPREAEFCEVTTPTSELVDEAHAVRAEAGNSPQRLEGNGDSQPNDNGRINTPEENPSREQTEVSEEKKQISRADNGCVRAGLGCSINNTEGEQRGEDICPRELDPPGECVSDKREGVQSSVEDTREKGSMAATTKDRPYSSEDRQYVHEMDNTEEEGSAIAHPNTESIGEETEQPGHYDTNGTSPGRAEHGGRCTQPNGEKAGLCTEGEESRRDSTNNRTEKTRYNFRTDCTGTLQKYLETILSEKEERERNTRRRHSASPSVPEKHWTDPEREDEGSPEGTNDSDSASLAGADLDPATAAWAFDKDPGDLSGVHDTGSEDEKGRLETTPRRGDIRHTGDENIQGRDLFLTRGEYVGAKEIAAAILKNQKSERDTWRALRRFKQFLDRESMDDTDPLTNKDAKWIIAEFTETLSNTNLSSGVIYQTVRTKTSGGEIIKVIIRKHPNPRIDAVVALQRWMDYTKTTLRDEHVWFDIRERQPANLQRIKEELVAVLRENGIPDTFTAYSIRHAVITHLARQEGADWKAINVYARWAPGSRVTQEYYTVLPVQDTRWILETIGVSVLQRGEDHKPDKSGDSKEGTLEIADADMKDRTEEVPKAGSEIGKKLTRKRSRGRKKLPSGEENRGETAKSRNSASRQSSCQKTPSIIPNSICELTGEKDPTPPKRRGKDRKRRSGRSIGQIGNDTEEARAKSMSPQRYPKRERL